MEREKKVRIDPYKVIIKLYFEQDPETSLKNFMSSDEDGCDELLDFNKIIPIPEKYSSSMKFSGPDEYLALCRERDLWCEKNWGTRFNNQPREFEYFVKENMVPMECIDVPFPIFSQLAKLTKQKIRITYLHEEYVFWGEAVFYADGSYNEKRYSDRYSKHNTPKELDEELGITDSLNDHSTWDGLG